MRLRFGYPAKGKNMAALTEEDTHYHLIDPVLREKGYDDLRRIRLETPAPVELAGSKGRYGKGVGWVLVHKSRRLTISTANIPA